MRLFNAFIIVDNMIKMVTRMCLAAVLVSMPSSVSTLMMLFSYFTADVSNIKQTMYPIAYGIYNTTSVSM